ncbi:uncharacterized protein Nmag_4091 (plasmid) [Natrialba magadii ATCC 43099]|uniref:Uncharacterized protein n=1 Tax=Natrialba magadii (strain ATCC 43099 / DSM 3394 / CCM 3739 / CIP 104546 / IAM 13178 / JCM 8861 / NBRC 102185 / NCIMB 2190 / MS3) TaxID=547559 RepID=D3T206_NATMM|nr:uncharacterized protein Nmag_4091 [Natrialba magadii ATCC 43099]ELY27091.1 hypothetical protein C500_14675 [Natrialba magadii ATCC 43099]
MLIFKPFWKITDAAGLKHLSDVEILLRRVICSKSLRKVFLTLTAKFGHTVTLVPRAL